MKNVLHLRRMFADLHHMRNDALIAINSRDKNLLRKYLTDMRRKIDAIEATLDD